MSFLNYAKNISSEDSENQRIWNDISTPEDIVSILQDSGDQSQLIYKHSHRCSICFLAKRELEDISEQVSELADLYMINVIHQRDLSNVIASKLSIRHESPQVIIIKDKKIIWKGSHWEIKGQDIWMELIKQSG